MNKTEFKDEAFQLTHKDLTIYLGFFFAAFIVLIGATIGFMEAAMALFGDYETWSVWAQVWIYGVYAITILAIAWVIGTVSKPHLARWLEERRVQAEDRGESVPVAFEATEQVWLDLETGGESRQPVDRHPPDEGDAAVGVPSGAKR